MSILSDSAEYKRYVAQELAKAEAEAKDPSTEWLSVNEVRKSLGLPEVS